MPKRYVVLPERGTLLVNTDIHGNMEDFERLSQLFDAALREDEEGVHWVILGDIVHGPNDVSRQKHNSVLGARHQDRSNKSRVIAVTPQPNCFRRFLRRVSNYTQFKLACRAGEIAATALLAKFREPPCLKFFLCC